MKTMIIKNIPDTLKKQFKVACTKNGRTMAAVLIELMMRYVETKI